MTLTKYAPIPVLLIAFMFIGSPFVAAESTVDATYIVDAPSEHEDQYDELVNVADEDSVTNPSTWNPTYQGIWLGGSTEESLYQFNDLLNDDSDIAVATEFMFTAQQIMSGVSEFVVRSPLYIDDTVTRQRVEIYSIPANQTYHLEYGVGGSYSIQVVFDEPENTYLVHGASLTTWSESSEQYWCVDGRAYFKMVAPIRPDVHYLFIFYARYSDEGAFKVYLSPNDILSDSLLYTSIGRYISPSILDPTTFTFTQTDLTLDAGVSFDMRNGLGGGFTAKSFYMYEGDVLYFIKYVPYGNTTNGYHLLMLPFITENSTARFSLEVETLMAGALWSESAYTYTDYIMPCSDAAHDVSSSEFYDNFFEIKLTSEWDQRVTFIFGSLVPVSDGIHSGYVDNYTRETWVSVASMPIYISFSPFCSYLIVDDEVAAPIPVEPGGDFVNEQAIERQQLLTASVGLFLVLSGVGGLVLTNVVTVFATPIAAAELVGLNLLVTNPSLVVTTGIGVQSWLTGELPNIPGFPFAGDSIGGFIKNLIDAAWDTLMGIGSWLYSIGEYIWHALEWIANAISYYGGMLLGLLAIAVIFLLFFFAIWFQLKLWLMGYRLARGDVEGAGKEGDNVASTVGKVV